ncbi:MAG TPA: hypothetical protein VFU05_07880, partial [Cyclobacteriaceae bacterium]|nr:hypothetical protein [Cyclobacteriaceae bacterium]
AADNRIHIDTIFHVSLAQMIKTYSVPSTGLNGLPFYHYHFGSHVIFAWLSKTLNINLFAFYQLSFPAVFLPLFVKSVLGLPIAWSEKKERVFNFNLWLWAAISAALIGVFPLYSVLAKALLEVLPVFASESYCVSIVLTFFFFNILLFNHDEKATGWVGFNLSVSLVLLGLVFLIGLSKNSTLFMIDILILYLFVRFKLYREWKAWLLFGIVGLMSIICLYLTVDSKSGDGSFVPFDFYERYTTLSVFDFLFVYFFWSIVLVGSCLFVIFFKKKADTPKYFITLAEIGLLISIVGALPGTFFSIAGGSAGYFMNVQMCFSLIFFLMILPEVIENLKIARGKIEESHKKRLVSIFLIVFTVMACINIQNNFRKSIKVYVKHTWEDKARICGISLESKPATFFGMVKDIVSLNSKIGSCLSSNTTYTIFQQLSELDTIPLKEKSKSILKLKNVNLLAEKFPCYKYPFFFTSLTGLALENGFVLDDCLDAQNYSFEYYRRADIEAQTPRQPATEFVISLDSGKVQLETLHSESATR